MTGRALLNNGCWQLCFRESQACTGLNEEWEPTVSPREPWEASLKQPSPAKITSTEQGEKRVSKGRLRAHGHSLFAETVLSAAHARSRDPRPQDGKRRKQLARPQRLSTPSVALFPRPHKGSQQKPAAQSAQGLLRLWLELPVAPRVWVIYFHLKLMLFDDKMF